MTARSDHSDLTTCDWTDEFCDCRDLGTIYSLITEEDLCARHYRKRMAQMAQMSSEASFEGARSQPRRSVSTRKDVSSENCELQESLGSSSAHHYLGTLTVGLGVNPVGTVAATSNNVSVRGNRVVVCLPSFIVRLTSPTSR